VKLIFLFFILKIQSISNFFNKTIEEKTSLTLVLEFTSPQISMTFLEITISWSYFVPNSIWIVKLKNCIIWKYFAIAEAFLPKISLFTKINADRDR
jgi:hypothetical protein